MRQAAGSDAAGSAGAAATGGVAPRRGPGRPTLSNEELLDRALDLFLEKGFDGTSIDAIAATAAMAKRTIYARYGDKTTLFRAALSRAIEEWIVPVERLRAQEVEDLEETLLRVGAILVENVLSPAGLRLLRLTNAESVRMPDIATENVHRGTGPTLDYLSDLFRRRLESAAGAGTDAEDAATAFLNLVVGGPASNAAWGMQLEPDGIAHHVRFSVRLFLHGLLDTEVAGAQAENAHLRGILDEAARQLDDVRTKLERYDRR